MSNRGSCRSVRKIENENTSSNISFKLFRVENFQSHAKKITNSRMQAESIGSFRSAFKSPFSKKAANIRRDIDGKSEAKK